MDLDKIKSVINKEVIAIILILIIVVGFSIYYLFQSYNNEEIITEDISDASDISEEQREMLIENKKIKIYITGEVNNPGVIELSEGERIEDAIMKADGITKYANLDEVNLAYKLEDGQKVYIPNINDKENIDILSTNNGENVIKEDAQKQKKININTANIDKLCEIPGVGEALAQRIIDYREKNGKFNSIDDLKNVSGIGEKKFEGLKEYITIK